MMFSGLHILNTFLKCIFDLRYFQLMKGLSRGNYIISQNGSVYNYAQNIYYQQI